MIKISDVKSILKKYNYKIIYSSYHQDKDINFYRYKKDAINELKYFTILTPEHRVVGRIYETQKNDKFLSEQHIGLIFEYFQRYQISNRDQIISDIKALKKQKSK